MIELITPVILTRDEEPNIGRTLERLRWAREVVIVDSNSSDRTPEIARTFPNVRFVPRTFTNLADQWAFGLAEVRTPWALTLDADYQVPAEFTAELEALEPSPATAGYECAFRYAVDGHVLRSTLYTPRVVLLRRDRASFYMDGHTQRVRLGGNIERLASKITHDDRKSFASFVARQRRYMRDEARKLRHTPSRELNAAGRIRKFVVVAPLAVLIHTLLAKRVILDGIPGLRYAYERFVAELILSWELTKAAFSRSA